MNPPDASFDLKNGIVANREEFLDIFELAEDAFINGDGTFVYQDRLGKSATVFKESSMTFTLSKAEPCA